MQQLTKRVLESALEGEITDHLGYDKHDIAARTGTNSRNGRRSKTVTTDVGLAGSRSPAIGRQLPTATATASPTSRSGGIDGERPAEDRRGPRRAAPDRARTLANAERPEPAGHTGPERVGPTL